MSANIVRHEAFMNLKYKAIVRIIGALFLITGIMLLLPCAVGLYYKEYNCSAVFCGISLFCIVFGGATMLLIRHTGLMLQKRDGYLIVSMAWLLMSAIGAFPFVINGCIPNFIDAFFEMCSGFSTTGSSILTDVEALPKSMLFWRSFTNWIGGMGILVFAVALLPSLGLSGQVIVQSEAPGPSLSKITPKMTDTAKSLYLIYTGLSIVLIILLMFGGMDLFDASTHTFATMGTGGFSTYNSSIAAFDSAYIDAVLTIFMLIAGCNFNLYYMAITGKAKKAFSDSEFKLFLKITAVSIVVITLYLFFTDVYPNIGQSLRYSSFQVATIITTTGFATANYDVWPTFCAMVIFILFFIGGCSSSTSGGLKVIRVSVLGKMLKRTLEQQLHPRAVLDIKDNNKIIPSDTVQNIFSFALLYWAMVAIIGLIVSLDGFDVITNFSAAASCLGNIGPGFHEVGPTVNYSIFSYPVKLVLSLAMIAGRLELFTFMLLFAPRFWNPSRSR